MPTEDIEKLWCHSYSHLPSRVVDSALSKAFPDFIGGVGFDASFPPYQDTVWYERRCCRYLSEVLRISERIAIEEESIRDAEQKLAELCKLRPGADRKSVV